MAIDLPIFISFVYIFFTMNFYGWGILHDKIFITFAFAITVLYISSHLFILAHKEKLMYISKFLVLAIFLLVSVFAVTFNHIHLRNGTVTYAFINDSGLQVEIGGKFLLLGKNPYTQSYSTTDLAKAPYVDDASNTINPALKYNAYPPFTLVLSAIGYRIFSPFKGWFDIRLVFLVFYILLMALSVVKFGFKENTLLYLILIGFNPLFINSMLQGSNDIIVFSLLLWSLFFAEKKRYILSAIIFGLSLATKQTAWFAVPFFGFYLWRTDDRRTFFTYIATTGLTSLLFYAPFMIWNFKALLDSLVLYMGGSVPGGYPINYFGFGTLLVALKVVPDIYAYYPFWIWQAVFGGVIIALFYYVQRKTITTSSMLYGYGLLLGVIWFFNRSMNFNYIAYLAVLISAAYLWSRSDKKGIV